MTAQIKHIDVVALPADALIYSTNVFLNCSGGVGSCLLSRYGDQVQKDLHQILEDSGVRYAPQGAIYEKTTVGMPYKAVFHTVPCDGFYDTSTEIVTKVLSESLELCNQRNDIKSVAISLLASGYGHMEPNDFLRIASNVIVSSGYDNLETVTVCIYDEYLYQQACQQIEKEKLCLEIES